MHFLKPKKHWGQHFLKERRIAEKIVSLLRADAQDQVVEIGPGPGVLSGLLHERYPNLALVEVDPDAVALLEDRFSGAEHPPRIINEDILRWNPDAYLRGREAFFIGNLPYNISSPIFFSFLENLHIIREGVFMIQKEVAVRICAPEGNKTYGILSVLIDLYFTRELAFSVPPGAFNPPPKVNSGVIRLVKRDVLPELPFDRIRGLVKAAFNQRRKTLRNALKGIPLLDFEGKEKMLSKRAEQLSPQEFLFLARMQLDS